MYLWECILLNKIPRQPNYPMKRQKNNSKRKVTCQIPVRLNIMLRPQHYRKLKQVKSQRRHWFGCVEETLLPFWRQMFGEEELHWRSLWFKTAKSDHCSTLAIVTCLRSHKQMQPKQVTYLLSPILSHLWLFSAQGLPVFKALEGFLTQCPVCTWTSVDVLPRTKPLGDEFPGLGACRTTSFKSHKCLVMPFSSYSSSVIFPFSRFPEITPGTAYLHFLLIWGEIRHSWILRRNFSHLFLVRWAFPSKKLILAKIMQGTLLFHKVLKEFLSAIIHLPETVLQIVVQLECCEQVSWMLLLPANQGRNLLNRSGEMFSSVFHHVNLVNNSKKPHICKGHFPVASALH